MEQIPCNRCKMVFEDTDYVVLDWTNALFHLRCFEPSSNIMKATNTYKFVKQKYWFFNKQLTTNNHL